MTVSKLAPLCMLLMAGADRVIATSLTTAAASIGAALCSQVGTSVATCSLNAAVGSQTARAGGAATSTWMANGSGILEATASGFGSGTIGQAAVSFSTPLYVTGVTGTGDLQINFIGIQDNIVNIPGGASVSPVTIGLGGASTTATLPNGTAQLFSVLLPMNFNTPVTFSASFNASATGTFFHDGTFALDDADGILQFPTFVVTNAAGQPIAGAAVSFTPEPASWLLVMFGLFGAAFWRERAKKIAAAAGTRAH